jgi:hypothetical protein
VKNKTKRITFRVDEALYNWLKNFSVLNKQAISDTIRNILIYFQYGVLIGEFKKSFSEMREEYLRIKRQKNK